MKNKEAAEFEADDFWSLVEPLKTRLYGFIRKSLNGRPEADDVYQETVLHAFQYRESFRRDGDFRAWVYGIAYNEIRRSLRNGRKKAALAAGGFPLVAAADENAPLIGEIFRFAAALKPKEREVFFLFYESGFSIAEIKRITGIREGHIKLLLHEARRRVRQALGVRHEG